MFENYSVLMSVYGREQADFFRLSTQSILAQTMPTNDFVLVCDGPLTEPLDKVIAELQETHSDILHIIRLENNQGLAKALNRGLQACKNELIARMDSDDVAVPNRCELQLRKFRENPELAIVGGEIDEFEKNPDNVISHKKMPHTHEEILRYAKTRNPFNHPTVMYRRSVILAAGSYPDHILHEDYALWSQLLLSGQKGYNLPQTLCYMRTDGGLYERRGGFSYLKLAVKLRWHLYCTGMCSLWDLIHVVSVLTVVCLVPNSVRRFIYLAFLRKD